MAMKRCSNGHFYDDTKHTQCPYCGVANLDLSVTVPIRRETPAAAPVERTQAKRPEVDKTVAKSQASHDGGKTVGLLKKEVGFDPVVGWLVCISGPSQGRDYRIKSERNFIGRSAKMDIAISGDDSISRDNHAVISYNPKNNSFKIMPGEGHGLVYLNDDEVLIPTSLGAHDIIELGQTRLMFIPFCGECFQWEKE